MAEVDHGAACHHVPVRARVQLMDAIVLPTLLFGLESLVLTKVDGAATGCASAHHGRADPEAAAKSESERRRLLQTARTLHLGNDPQDGPRQVI